MRKDKLNDHLRREIECRAALSPEEQIGMFPFFGLLADISRETKEAVFVCLNLNDVLRRF